jgi:Inhibitor of vertebrate lysozyme (Ivy)
VIKRPLLVIALLLCGASVRAADAPSGPYLFDLLKQKPYLAAWNGMLAGASVPAWVKSYTKTFDGPSSPSKSVPLQGKVYTLGWVCKAHDCGDNQLHVLFAPGAAQAWGLLTTSGQQKWLGNPDATIQTAINSNLE